MPIASKKIRGVMQCPVCRKEKFVNVNNATGQTSQRCHNCGRLLLLDWDKMAATETKPIKGAYQMVVNE